MVTLTGRIHKILPEKKIRENFSVVEVILYYPEIDQTEQYRYLQAINRQAKRMLEDIEEGNLVTVRIALKGKKKDNEQVHNLDEIYEITRV